MAIELKNGEIQLGSKTILKEVDVSFQSGITGLIGSNGAGKSTLLRSLLAMIPLSRGEVILDSKEIGQYSRREIAQRIGYLAQSIHIPFPILVEDVVMMGRYAQTGRFEPETVDDRAAVNRAIERVRIEELRGRPLDELSGGERQRVFLAQVLATGAKTLLLDEPIANLDLSHCFDFMDILKEEAAEGKTIVIAMHDLTMAYQYCDRLLLLGNQRVLAHDPTEDVMSSKYLEESLKVRAHFHEFKGKKQCFFERKSL